MNREEFRLATFQNWPSTASIEAGRLAAAGFYYIGPHQQVRCYACGGVIPEWSASDQPMHRHQLLSPDCAFLRNPERAGNVPLVSASSSSHSPSHASGSDMAASARLPMVGRWESQSLEYRSEQARLDSFAEWPIPFIVRPEALAAAGFYFLGQGDKVKCAFCTGIINRWEPGDIPETEHRRHFPKCPFVLGLPVGNIAHAPNHASFDDLCTRNNLQELGIQAHRGPKHPKFSTVESRLRTFQNWPLHLSQRPSDLAQAGFYYIQPQPNDATTDQVRCFHCDGGLRHWEPDDSPWREHARWFPGCPFLLLVKGQPYVNEVQEAFRSAGAALNDTSTSGRQQQDGAATTSSQRNVSSSCDLFSGSAAAKTLNSSPLSTGLSASMPSLSENSSRVEGVGDFEVLQEENRRLKDARQCKICMDAEIGTCLLPCGHLVSCVSCAPSLLDCPLCRVPIKATVRTYLS